MENKKKKAKIIRDSIDGLSVIWFKVSLSYWRHCLKLYRFTDKKWSYCKVKWQKENQY